MFEIPTFGISNMLWAILSTFAKSLPLSEHMYMVRERSKDDRPWASLCIQYERLVRPWASLCIQYERLTNKTETYGQINK
jgi:hypothetical protein